jgi:hypothetical protein
MTNPTDSKGNAYIEMPISGGALRLTYVPDGWDNSPAVRIQIKDGSTGRLRQGPEVPVGKLGEMYSSLLDLLVNEHDSNS